jgi:uncharacterized protein YuzE
MQFRHDPQADAVYITLREGTFAHGVMLGDTRVIDFDAERHPLGVELLYVSSGVDVRGLPEQDAIARLLTAHGIAVTSQAEAPSHP